MGTLVKVAILGSDSTHTESYADLMNRPRSPFYKKVRVLWLWGKDRKQTIQKAHFSRIAHIAKTPKEAVRDADLVMVLNRFGEDHFKNAKIAIDSGKPTYVDKPFTNSPREALRLRMCARSKSVPLASFSPYRFAPEVQALARWAKKHRPHLAIVEAPLGSKSLRDPRANNVYFYGIHAVEILGALFGFEIKSVAAGRACRETLFRGEIAEFRARHSGGDRGVSFDTSRLSRWMSQPIFCNCSRIRGFPTSSCDEGILIRVLYRDGRQALVHLTKNKGETYRAFLLGKKNIAKNIDPWGPFYKTSLSVLLKNSHTWPPVSEAVKTIKILSAIETSVRYGKEIKI